MQHSMKSNRVFTTSNLTKIAVLSAIAYILAFISIPLPMFFASFLKIDVSDLPALLGGLSLGPVSGVVIALLKNLLQAVTGMSTTGGVGEFANFLIGGSFVLVVSLAYKYKREFSGLLLGLVAGVVVMTIVGCVANYFIILPAYELAGWTTEAVVDMGRAINPMIDDKLSFVIWMIGPFNVLKAVIMSLLTVPMYKKTEKVLRK